MSYRTILKSIFSGFFLWRSTVRGAFRSFIILNLSTCLKQTDKTLQTSSISRWCLGHICITVVTKVWWYFLNFLKAFDTQNYEFLLFWQVWESWRWLFKFLMVDWYRFTVCSIKCAVEMFIVFFIIFNLCSLSKYIRYTSTCLNSDLQYINTFWKENSSKFNTTKISLIIFNRQSIILIRRAQILRFLNFAYDNVDLFCNKTNTWNLYVLCARGITKDCCTATVFFLFKTARYLRLAYFTCIIKYFTDVYAHTRFLELLALPQFHMELFKHSFSYRHPKYFGWTFYFYC